jgi:Bacterial protein of unknown function (DUF899)
MKDELGAPKIVDQRTFQAELDALRVREKAHTREGDAIAAARRRLPMVAVDGATPLIGERGALTLLDAFEGRQLLIAYYFIWHLGDLAAEQCEGCTFCTTQVRELDYLHSRERHLRDVLPRPVRRERPVSRLHGRGDAVVLGPRLARHPFGGTPGGHDVHRLLPATRIQCLRDVLDDGARRGGDGQHLRFARHDGLRAAGRMGGLADRLAETRAPFPYRSGRRWSTPPTKPPSALGVPTVWTSHRPMVSPEGRALRRSSHW